MNIQKQPPEVFCKKGFLRNFQSDFAKFTGKHLCQGLTQMNFAKFLRTLVLQNTSGPLLLEHRYSGQKCLGTLISSEKNQP